MYTKFGQKIKRYFFTLVYYKIKVCFLLFYFLLYDYILFKNNNQLLQM